jgi:2,5-diamino-6-(ribosylamino)-4(3H)-pyrimidinone 5'-phosphate reductase
MYTLEHRDSDTPYLFANFAVTLDGKVASTASPYWPIASRLDFEVVEELRAQADVLIHGKTTALEHRHADFLNKPDFADKRTKFGKQQPYVYMVISGHADTALAQHVSSDGPTRAIVVTTKQSRVDDLALPKNVEVWRIGETEVDLPELRRKLADDGLRSALVEGGPTLFGSFVADDLIDELFLTVSPKLLGMGQLSLLEGTRFTPEAVPALRLIESHTEKDELYLRYSFRN